MLEQLVLFGGGGHAAVCSEVFVDGGRSIVGYVAPVATTLSYKYLGDDETYLSSSQSDVEAFVAVGSNQLRMRITEAAQIYGQRLAGAVHSSAIVSSSASIGVGSIVMPGAIINARAKIGAGVIVNSGAVVEHDVIVEDFVHVGPGSRVAGGAMLRRGVLLGVGASVIPNVTIGEWSVVGAGAAVVRDVKQASVAVGVPARLVKAAR